jgi:hypothetical protein
MFNFLLALILAVGLFLPFYQPVKANTFDVQVNAAADDCHYNGGSFYLGAGYIQIGESRGTGLRFTNVAIPNGASITSAYITFVANNSLSGAACKVNIYGEDVDNAVTYSTYADMVGRSLTVATSWNPVSSWSTGSSYNTPSLTSIVTSIVARPGWVSGNAMAFQLKDNGSNLNAYRQGWSYDGNSNYAAVLHIDYASIATVTTQSATAIAPTTATGNGNVTSNGGLTITEKGICYVAGSSGDPTTADSTSHDHIDSAGAYSEPIAGLTKGTAYRLRAYAINALGTGYGTTVDMTTINDPTISTVDASLVTSATARLNSQVTFDGGSGEPCTVTFVYFTGSPYADYAAILAAGGTEVVVAIPTATYTTGQFPYYDVSSLTIGTLYSFAVKIVNSTATTAYGSVLTFTTETGIADSSNFTAIPTSTTISLAWVKGLGSQYTLVRYSDSSCPATVLDGTLGYLNTGNSVTISGLTSGTTYYFSAWGKTGGLYSAMPITVIATTLAYDASPTATQSLVTPTPDSTWTQTPSSVKTSTIPLFGTAIQGVATAYNQPVNYVWYFAWVLAAVGAAIVVYIKGNFNFVLSLSVMVGIIGLGVWWYNMVPGMIVVVIAVIGIGWALVGFRRPGT